MFSRGLFTIYTTHAPGKAEEVGGEAGSEAGVLRTPGGQRPSLPAPTPPAPGGGAPACSSSPERPSLSRVPPPPLPSQFPAHSAESAGPSQAVEASALLVLPRPLPSDPEMSTSPGRPPSSDSAARSPSPAPSLWTPSLGVTFLARAGDTPACGSDECEADRASVCSDRPGGGVSGTESPAPLHPRDPRSDPHAAPPWPQWPWFPPQKLPASIPGPLTPVFPRDLSGPWVSCPPTFDPAGLTLGSLMYKRGRRPPELRGHPPTAADTTSGYKVSTNPATALVSPAVIGEMFDK